MGLIQRSLQAVLELIKVKLVKPEDKKSCFFFFFTISGKNLLERAEDQYRSKSFLEASSREVNHYLRENNDLKACKAKNSLSRALTGMSALDISKFPIAIGAN